MGKRDLVGKTILITGATDGLGRGVALELAARGATLLIHGRNRQRVDAILAEVEAQGAAAARGYLADFAELAQVRAMAGKVLAAEPRLDVLVNNAGIGTAGDRRESLDGHELVFQVDYLAPYLLTQTLLPLLERSAPSRIVNVASLGQAPIDFDDVMLKRNWSGAQAYRQAKLAQISMTFDMAEELKPRGIAITALHPATFMPTKMVVGRYQPVSTLEEGVANVVRLVADPTLDGVSGVYYNGAVEAKAHAQAYDLKARAKLRALSHALTQEQP